MALGSRLKELRLRNGESLQKVADAVGASKAHIWELETGKSQNPSLELLKNLAEHFEITVSSLIGETPGDSEDLLVMYRGLQGLTDEDREFVQTVMDTLKKKRKKRASDGD